MSPYEKIIDLFESNGIWSERMEHEPVFTSEQAAAVRGLSLAAGAKSLLVKAGDDFVLVVLSGDKKADWKKLKKILDVKNICMATPEEVKEKMGVEIGACYPFGNIVGLRTLADKSLLQQEIISCNPGRHDISIKFKASDYQKLTKPELASVAD